MKVLAEAGGGKFICEVSQGEVNKLFNKSAYTATDEMLKMKIGKEINLAAGYDFRDDINSALRETRNFLSANAKVITTITKGVKFLARQSEERDDE